MNRADALPYVLLILATGVAYFTAAVGRAPFSRSYTPLFGFDQLYRVPPTWLGAWFGAAAVALGLSHFAKERLGAAVRRLSRSSWLPWIAAVAAVPIFFALKSDFVNEDGEFWLLALSEKGTFGKFDEMFEVYYHWRLSHLAHDHLGWSIKLAYQALSAAAGGIFIFALFLAAKAHVGDRAVALVALVASGAFMQMFFGDVEHYSLTTAVMVAYFYVAALFLQDRLSIVWPCSVATVALVCHLLSGFLAPAVFYLLWVEYRRRGKRGVLLSLLVGLAIGVAALTFFHFNGVPLQDIPKERSKATSQWFTRFNAWRKLNLLALLFPGFPLVAPLIAQRRIPLRPINVHLSIAAGVMGIFFVGWEAGLGIIEDWNLFAPATIPMSLLVWTNMLTSPGLPFRPQILIALFSLYAPHSYSWIVSNARWYPLLYHSTEPP